MIGVNFFVKHRKWLILVLGIFFFKNMNATPLMSVTHKNYSPPSFDIFFQAKDLKKQYYLKN